MAVASYHLAGRLTGVVKKVVYLNQQPLSHRDYRRFGIPLMLERGHQVTMLDVAPITVPIPHDRSHYGEFKDIRVEVVEPGGLGAAGKVMAEADLLVNFFAGLSFSRRHIPLLREMTRSGTPYVIEMTNPVPGTVATDRQTSFVDRVQETWTRRNEIDYLGAALIRLPLPMLGIRPASAIIHGGYRSRGPSMMANDTTKMLITHAMDYDIYMEEAARISGKEDIAVFIDQNRPFSPDAVEYGARNKIDPDLYFGRLRVLFDRIEAKTGLEVVIALHPRAKYGDKPEYFGGRRMISGNAANLIGRSKLVIAHQSTAINFAVLFRVPVMITATDDLINLQVWHKYWYGNMAKELGTRVRYFDDPEQTDLDGILDYDEAAFAAYEANYIKVPGTPRRPYWHIAIDGLREAGIIDL